MRPILAAEPSTNHMFPSGPRAMRNGPEFLVGVVNSVTFPRAVIRPTWLAFCSVNHIAPSAVQQAMPDGPLFLVGRMNSLT
jgi:hypothetical protein